MIIEGSCHCGAIQIKVDGEIPEKLTSCNCSFCHRSGNLMAYYHPSQVKITADPKGLLRYIWGDKQLAHVHCGTCGCYSHWESIDPNITDRIGLNARLFTNIDIWKIRVRHFDGRDTWKFLD